MVTPYSPVKTPSKKERKEKVLKSLSPITNRKLLRNPKNLFQKNFISEEGKVKQNSPLIKENLIQKKEGARVKRLIQFLMVDGKKEKARKIVREAILYTRLHKGLDFSSLLYQAVENTSSLGKLRSRRRGSQKLRVPFPLSLEQQESTGLRRLVAEARKLKGPMAQSLAQTVWKAAQGEGAAVGERKAELDELRKNQGNIFLRWL